MRSVATLFDDMDRFFDNTGFQNRFFADKQNFLPPAEISENETQYLLSVDLPGLKKEDLKIEVVDSVLTITGERKREKRSDGERVTTLEKAYGSFKRSFRLPNTLNADKIEARYEDGVLELSLPKSEAAQPRRIEIQTH